MNPSSTGWIKKYFSLIQGGHKKDLHFEHIRDGEVIYYHVLQSSGFTFGYAGGSIYLNQENRENWSEKEKMKVLYLEALLFTYSFTHFIEPEKAEEDVVEELCEYLETAEISTAKRGLFAFGSLSPYEKLELLIQQKLDFDFKIDKNIWVSYFYNVLVFPDVYFYYKKCIDPHFDFSIEKRKTILKSLLKLIAIAAQSDGNIEKKEQSIFTLFLQSAGLNEEENLEMIDIWETQNDPNELVFTDLPEDYIIKRYFLDMTVLTLWSDEKLEDEESRFLKILLSKLALDDYELQESLAGVKTFILSHGENVAYLQDKTDLERLYSGFTSSWGRVISRNKNKIARELGNSGELVKLITISTIRDLTPDERKSVRKQFASLTKSIPALTIFMLPGGAVLLPIILKIIPGLIPDAFRDNKIVEETRKEEEEKKKKKN